MLFLVWSLFYHAIRFGRRHRLVALLSEHFAVADGSATAHQRRHQSLRDGGSFGRNAMSSSAVALPIGYKSIFFRPMRTSSSRRQIFHMANSKLHRVTSEPTLSSTKENFRRIYYDEKREIVLTEQGDHQQQTAFCPSDWAFELPQHYTLFQSNHSQNYAANYVCFSVKVPPFVPLTIPSSFSVSTRQQMMALNSNYLDSFARFIAQHRTNPSVRLYTAPISAFIDLAFYWSEGTLFDRKMGTQIEEIRTVPCRPFESLGQKSLLSFCAPKGRLCASVPTARPPSLLELMFLRDDSVLEKADAQRANYGGEFGRSSKKRAFSRFSTAFVTNGDSARLPNYLKITRRRRCNNAASSVVHCPSPSPCCCFAEAIPTKSFPQGEVQQMPQNVSATSAAMKSNTLALPPFAHSHLSRSNSLLMASSSAITSLRLSAEAMRRRSLSPLTLSLLVNYGAHQQQHSVADGSSANSTAVLFSTTDPHFPGKLLHRRAQSVPRRSYGSFFSGSDNSEHVKRHNVNRSDDVISATPAAHNQSNFYCVDRPRQKPPALLVYCGDDKTLFDRIRCALRRIVPADTYTISALSTKALIAHPWTDTCACLIIADTSRLDNASWQRLQTYFVNSGKILFVCENSLLATLTSTKSQREQSALLKNAFGNRAVTATMGKEFGNFLKRSLKGLARNGQINETFNARDSVGDTCFSVVLHKNNDQPLLLYMHNLGQCASALFSDATTEQLLYANDGALIGDALRRLGLKDIWQKALPLRKKGPPPLSSGYLIAARDLAILDIPGMTYDKVLGGCSKPALIFYRSAGHQQVDYDQRVADRLVATDQLLPVEVRRRRDGLPERPTDNCRFDVEHYFGLLTTKRLGQVLLYVPICGTTMETAKSLSNAFPLFDGILVVAGTQLAGRGRGGNDWISPAGCAMFTFNFNIPCDSNLGRSISFLQHITAVSVASAVSKLLHDEVPHFPIRLKWPNDIYYERRYKLGGLLVQVSQCDANLCCAIGVGLNVANAKPTICINDMLPIHSNRRLTVEEVLAQTMNEFEHFVTMFENRGKAAFMKTYYAFWMHSHEEVQILRRENGESREKVVIRGLDEYGYLEVRSKETGQIMTVMDDGNTFDMFHGLIVPK